MIDGLWKKASLSSSTAEVPLLLMDIEHPDLTQPIRVATDKADVVSGGNTYVGIPLDVALPQDRSDETPAVSIGMGNVSPETVKALREIQGDDVQVTLRAVLASNPDHTQAGPYVFTLTSAQWDSIRINGQIGYEQLLNQVLPAYDITPQNLPGSF